MSDASMLAVLKSKTNYQRFVKFIRETSVSKECNLIVKGMQDYYAAYPMKDEVDWDLFEVMFFALKARHISGDEAITCRKLMHDAKGLSHSTDVQEEIIKHYVKLSYAYSVAEKATAIVTGSGDSLEVLEELIKEHDREVGKLRFDDEHIFVSSDLDDVLKSVSEVGYEWRLEELNRSCGPIRTGDFIILAARPETGKTTFLSAEVSYWAAHVTENNPIIWVNNEERSDKVMNRVIQAYFGVTSAELMADKAKFRDRYNDTIGNRIRIINNDSGLNDVRNLDALFRDRTPSIIVFDQLDKVEGFGGESREDLRLGKLYKWGREKAHQYGPTIAVSQATGDDFNKWIRMSDLRGSKTDKAGEADAIITIGKSSEMSEEYNRFIHVPKNKLHGGPRSVESERHGYYEVKIVPTIARYESAYK